MLMQAYRWIIDSRDEYTDERLEKIGKECMCMAFILRNRRGYEAWRMLASWFMFSNLPEGT